MTTPEFLTGGGQKGERIRSFDWSKTPLGPPDDWPDSLKGSFQNMLSSLEESPRASIELNEAQFHSLVKQFPVAIMVLKGATHIIEIANQMALEISGKTLEQIISLPALVAMPELESQGFGNILDEVYQTGKPFIANEFPVTLIKHGLSETLYINFIYEPLRNANGKPEGIMGVGIDVTEQVIARKRVEESKEQLRHALEAGELGTFDYYPQSGELIWSDKTKELFGLPPEAEVDYSIYLKGLHPADKKRADAAAQKAMDAQYGGLYENEYRTIGLTDGKLRWVRSKGLINFDTLGKPLRFTGVIQDITKIKETLASLQLQSLVFNSMDEGVSVSDEEGYILLTNPAEDKIFGYDRGELLGRHVTVQNACLPDENERLVRPVIAELKEKGFWSGEWHNRKKDGTHFYTHSFITTLAVDGKTLFVCVQRDITEEKNDKEKLAFRTALLEAQKEAIPDALLIVDTKGKMLSYNQHFVELWNIPHEIMARKDDAAALEYAMTQLRDPQHFIDRVNYCYDHPHEAAHEEVLFIDGRIIERYGNAVVGENGRSYGWAWYFRDITETKNAEEGLKRYRHMADNANEAFILMREDGSFAYLNNVALERWGYSIEEIQNIRVPDVDPIYNDEIFNAIFAQAQKEKLSPFETLHKRKDGTIYPVEVNMGGLMLEGKPHMFAIARDITARKKAEEALKFAKEQLELTFKNIPAGVYLFNEKGELVYVNEIGAQVYGDFTPEYLLAEKDLPALLQKAEELFERYDETGNPFKPQDSPAYITLTTGRSSQAVLKQINRTNKEERWHYIQGAPLLNDTGNVSTVLVTSTDITIQKSAEEKMRQSEERFRSLANSIPQLAWMADAKGWIYWYNQRWYDYTGTTLEQMQGWGWQSVHHPDLVEKVKNELSEAFAKGIPYDDTFLLRSKEGKFRWFLTRAVPIRNTAGEIVQWFGTNTDVSDQIEIKEALKRAKEQLELTFKNVPSAIYHFDKNGKILYLNEKGAHQMGYASVEEVLVEKDVFNFRKKLDETFLVQDERGRPLPADQSSSALTFQSGKASEVIAQFIHKQNGSSFWLLSKSAPLYDENGELAIVLTTSTDITLQKTSEQNIRQSEENFRTLAETLPQLVWMTNEKGEQLYASSKWKEYTGIQPEGTETWQQMIHPDDFAILAHTWQQSMETGNLYRAEARMKNAAGEYHWHFVQGEAIVNEEEKIVKWIGAFTDIHDQKTLAEKLENLVAERTKELARSNEDLQQFAHVASHDLKEPVRKIKMYGSVLLSEFGELIPGKGKIYMGKIETAANRMYDMIDGVLLYSSLNAVVQTAEKIELNTVMLDIESDLEIMIQQKEATIEYKNLHGIKGSGVLIHQLFYNLVNNALKFSNPNKKTTITIHSSIITQKDVATNIALTPGMEYVKIIVKDNGIGFNADHSESIFITFSRLNSKDKYEGTGLGLALCKKIVERHKGFIYADGKEGEGATFTIILPVNEG